MTIAARCTCGLNLSGIGELGDYCPRHTTTPRPTGAPPSVGEYLTGVEDRQLTTRPVENQKPANLTHNAMPALAVAIHYPDCWDQAAYPTLASALNELAAGFRCTNEHCTCGVAIPLEGKTNG